MTRRFWVGYALGLLIVLLAGALWLEQLDELAQRSFNALPAAAVSMLWHMILGALLAVPFVDFRRRRPHYPMLLLVGVPMLLLASSYTLWVTSFPLFLRRLAFSVISHIPRATSPAAVVLGYVLVAGLFSWRSECSGE